MFVQECVLYLPYCQPALLAELFLRALADVAVRDSYGDYAYGRMVFCYIFCDSSVETADDRAVFDRDYR